jgi:hypothetical protein
MLLRPLTKLLTVLSGGKSRCEVKDYDWAYFTKLSDARAYADSKSKEGLIVWVSELGDCQTESGNAVRTWFYYWWTDAANLGAVMERGRGFKTSELSSVVTYEPIDKTGWDH